MDNHIEDVLIYGTLVLLYYLFSMILHESVLPHSPAWNLLILEFPIIYLLSSVRQRYFAPILHYSFLRSFPTSRWFSRCCSTPDSRQLLFVLPFSYTIFQNVFCVNWNQVLWHATLSLPALIISVNWLVESFHCDHLFLISGRSTFDWSYSNICLLMVIFNQITLSSRDVLFSSCPPACEMNHPPFSIFLS